MNGKEDTAVTWPVRVIPVAVRVTTRTSGPRSNRHETIFELGLVVATAGAALALAKSKTQPDELLDRHRSADFGEVDQARTDANLAAIQSGGQIASAYLLATGDVVLAVTENGSTTLMTPPELDQPWE